MSSYEISLRDELKKRDEELFGRLSEIEKIAKKILVYTQSKFPYYTPHGFTHSKNVEDCLNWLIPDELKEKLLPHEMFFLILASWFHDWGMVASQNEDPEEVRNNHEIRTEININNHYNEIRVNRQEAIILGKICRGHRKENLMSEYYDHCAFSSGIMINVRFLAALLRVADEFDITANRVPEVIFYELEPNSKAKEEFEKHLSIIGVAYAKDLKYKVIISAIAKNPKSAETIHHLRDKLQKIVDSVKTILATNKIELDIVEINLTTQGFIYKPIKFEIDKRKIIDVLIGEHLYKSRDVTIRELIQNSIDACNIRKKFEPNIDYFIKIIKLDENTIEIIDNGYGMNYDTAKKFLSLIGSTFYDSEEFYESFKKLQFDPIAKFGIGIISCFLIADEIYIETKRDNFDPCRFTISSIEKLWNYEKGSLNEPGTKILLKLNDFGQKINIKDTIEKYIISIEIPLYYKNLNEEIIEFKDNWNFDYLTNKYTKLFLPYREFKVNKLFEYDKEEYRLILTLSSGTYDRGIYLFNHGIFIGNFLIPKFKQGAMFFIDIKKDIIDYQLSREDIIKNIKFFNFMSILIKDILKILDEKYLPKNIEEYILLINNIFENRFYEAEFIDNFFELDSNKYILSFLENQKYFALKNKKLKILNLSNLLKYKKINFYNYDFKRYEEIEYLKQENIFKEQLILNYESIYTISKTHSILKLKLNKNNIETYDFNLGTLLKSKYKLLNKNICNYVPKFIIFSEPDDNLPLLFQFDKIRINKNKDDIITPYLVVYTLLKEVLKSNMNYDIISQIYKDEDRIDLSYESSSLIILNTNDQFIKKIYDLDIDIKKDKSSIIKKYLTYISLIPLYSNNEKDFLFIMDIINYLEEKISNFLKIEKYDSFIYRLNDITKIYINYLEIWKLYDEKEI